MNVEPMSLSEFLATYDPDGTRVVVELDATRKNHAGNHQFVVVRCGEFAAVLTLMHVTDHLCIDVHPFADEHQATAGAFGMSDGQRVKFPNTSTTSHGWPSANLVSVLVGEQNTEPKESTR